MSAVLGTNATLAATADPNNMVPFGEGSAPVYSAIDTYTTTTLASASTITMCAPFPPNAYVTSIEIFYEDEASSATLAVGITANSAGTVTLDATKFLAASAISSGPGILKCNENMNTLIGGSQILLTTGGATLSGSALITIVVQYVKKIA